ncbi:cell division protein FtsH, partial [bacterium]|nr:cell division protein FtsH [bacterium]
DRRVVVDLPDVRGREAILKVHARQVKMSKKVDFKIIAKSTPGLSGADLANLINEAALLAARRRAEYVDMRDFENAKDKVMMGIERKSMVISDKEKEITAYHEAGHALVATLLPDADPIHKVTIIPRGMALGLTHQLPIDERHNYSRSYIVTQIKILLGGRIAEKVVFDELTTGGGNDIERATEIARKMVTKWGMSDVIGPMTFEENSEEIFLGRDISRQKNISDETAKIIDREVAKIIRSAEREVTALLKANIELLKSLFKALLSKETLNNREIQEIVNKSSKQAPAVKKEKQRETNKKKVSEKIRKKPTRIKTQKSQKSDKKQGQSPGKKADSELLVLPKPSDERPTIQADSKTEEKNIEKSQVPSQSGIIFVESAEEKNKNKEKKS